MQATTTIRMSDLSGQRSLETDLTTDLTPQHTVGQAVETYLETVGTPDNGLRWTAFSRGVRLDMKDRLADLTEADAAITVLPEVSAGGGNE